MSIDLRRADPDRRWQLPIIVLTPLVVFTLVAFGVASGWSVMSELDDRIAQGAYDFGQRNAWFVTILEIIAVVFNSWLTSLYLIVLAAWFYRVKEPAVTVWILLSTALVMLGNPVLKWVFDRPRPTWDSPLYEIGGLSFPSGHSANAGVFFTVVALLTVVFTGRGIKRRLLIGLWVGLAFIVGGSRIGLGVHYVSDVVAGLMFGHFVAVALWWLIVRGRGRLPAELAMFTGSGRKRSAVVLNPAKVGDVELFKSKVRHIAKLNDWAEPVWFETTVEDPGHGQTAAALAADVDMIIAAGGDGTVRAVCDVAARSGVAIGVLPHGTGNLLARNLGIPVNTRDALDVVFGGQDMAIDLARFTTDSDIDTSFLVMAGLGMDAAMMSGVNDELKNRVGYLAYFVSGAKALRFPATKVIVTIDDQEPQKFRARTVVVGNVGFLQGGIPLLPDAQIDDGKLDVIVVAPKRFIGWLAIVARVITRRPHSNERLARLSGERVLIEAERSVPMQLDGDAVGEGHRIEAEVEHCVVLVRVPVGPRAAS